MSTPRTGQISGQRGQRRVLRTGIIVAAIVLLFTTVTLAGPCHTQTPAPIVAKPAVSKQAVAKAVAKAVVTKPVAAAAHAVVQAAATSAPRKISRVRAAVAQALLRLPTTPLASLLFLVLTCIASVPVYRRARAIADGSRPLPHGQYRALLQVFLI
jgi:hypothetical protein